MRSVIHGRVHCGPARGALLHPRSPNRHFNHGRCAWSGASLFVPRRRCRSSHCSSYGAFGRSLRQRTRGSPWSPRRSRRPRSSLGQSSPTRSHEPEAKRHGLSVQDVMLYVSGGTTASLLKSSALRRVRAHHCGALDKHRPRCRLRPWGVWGVIGEDRNLRRGRRAARLAERDFWRVFNLLPEVPLDGGHLPEATVRRITLNHSRATAKSTRAGQILGALIIVFGLNEVVFVTGASSWAGRLAREDLNRDVFVGGQITGMTSSPKVS